MCKVAEIIKEKPQALKHRGTAPKIFPRKKSASSHMIKQELASILIQPALPRPNY